MAAHRSEQRQVVKLVLYAPLWTLKEPPPSPEAAHTGR